MQNNILTDHRSKRNVQQTCWECSQKLRMNMRDKVSSRISAITFKLSIFWLYGTKGWAEEMTLEVGMPLILTGACRRVMLHLYHLRVTVFCLAKKNSAIYSILVQGFTITRRSSMPCLVRFLLPFWLVYFQGPSDVLLLYRQIWWMFPFLVSEEGHCKGTLIVSAHCSSARCRFNSVLC